MRVEEPGISDEERKDRVNSLQRDIPHPSIPKNVREAVDRKDTRLSFDKLSKLE